MGQCPCCMGFFSCLTDEQRVHRARSGDFWVRRKMFIFSRPRVGSATRCARLRCCRWSAASASAEPSSGCRSPLAGTRRAVRVLATAATPFPVPDRLLGPLPSPAGPPGSLRALTRRLPAVRLCDPARDGVAAGGGSPRCPGPASRLSGRRAAESRCRGQQGLLLQQERPGRDSRPRSAPPPPPAHGPQPRWRPPRLSLPQCACARRVPVTRACRGVGVHAPPPTRPVMAPSWALAAARAGARPWRLRLPAGTRCGSAGPAGAPPGGTLLQQTEERPGTGTTATGPRQVRAQGEGRAESGGSSGGVAAAGWCGHLTFLRASVHPPACAPAALSRSFHFSPPRTVNIVQKCWRLLRFTF